MVDENASFNWKRKEGKFDRTEFDGGVELVISSRIAREVATKGIRET